MLEGAGHGTNPEVTFVARSVGLVEEINDRLTSRNPNRKRWTPFSTVKDDQDHIMKCGAMLCVTIFSQTFN